MLVPKPMALAPVQDEASAATLRLTIESPFIFSAPAQFPGLAEIRGPIQDLRALIDTHDGWRLWVDWVEGAQPPTE
jgi:hypothetical protein